MNIRQRTFVESQWTCVSFRCAGVHESPELEALRHKDLIVMPSPRNLITGKVKVMESQGLVPAEIDSSIQESLRRCRSGQDLSGQLYEGTSFLLRISW